MTFTIKATWGTLPTSRVLPADRFATRQEAQDALAGWLRDNADCGYSLEDCHNIKVVAA